jgi:SAM-dependent methyltransferase
MGTDIDNTRLFSGRVADYQRFRPHYPASVADFLRTNGVLKPELVVADIGAGTGIVIELIAGEGRKILAVEPNPDMADAIRSLQSSQAAWNVRLVPAPGEKTTLSDGSVDVITIGSAFHWLDQSLAREEFRRILKPDGWVVILYNERDTENDPFQREYEGIYDRFIPDHVSWGHRRTTLAGYRAFFRGPLFMFSAPNPVMSDFAGLVGVSRSTSHYPIGDPERRGKIEAALREIFEKYQKSDGQVAVNYLATLYAGRLGR